MVLACTTQSRLRIADNPPPKSHHNRLNFNTYKEGMMTLFILLVVNDWNIISGNFVQVRERNQPNRGSIKALWFLH